MLAGGSAFRGLVMAIGSFFLGACATGYSARESSGRKPASLYATSFANDRNCTAKIARRIFSGRPEVPRALYRFGTESVLRPHVEHGISESEWRTRFRGPGSLWKLPGYRRGLYGTAKPFRADPFADRERPAMIRVSLRESCRAPDRVGTTLDISEDSRFRKFLGAELDGFVARCVRPGKSVGRLYTPIGESPAAPESDTVYCEETVETFFDRSGIQVVQDEAVEASWYVRDLACIEKIEGTVDDLVRMFGEKGFTAEDECGYSTHALSTFRVFMRALFSEESIRREGFASVRKEWVDAHREMPAVSAWMPEMIDAYLRCHGRGDLRSFRTRAAEFDRELAEITHYSQHVYVDGFEPDPRFREICL